MSGKSVDVRVLFCAAGLTALFFLGCTQKPQGPETVKVTGEVLLDGAPLPEGDIAFRRADGDQKGFGGRISDGRYHIVVEPGTMKVEIRATRVVPGKFTTENVTPEPLREMYIPAKYNSKSTLVAEVGSGQSPTIPFELKSK